MINNPKDKLQIRKIIINTIFEESGSVTYKASERIAIQILYALEKSGFKIIKAL
jgi:hypothetical protein